VRNFLRKRGTGTKREETGKKERNASLRKQTATGARAGTKLVSGSDPGLKVEFLLKKWGTQKKNA
jgi:hypothetical protein